MMLVNKGGFKYLILEASTRGSSLIIVRIIYNYRRRGLLTVENDGIIYN